jgi:PA domain
VTPPAQQLPTIFRFPPLAVAVWISSVTSLCACCPPPAAYGDTVTGKLIAPNATDGCSPIMPSQSWGSDFILLLPRGGGCSFETKVFNAQQAGASGALIGDTSLLCGDRNAAICNSLCSDYCGYRNVIPPTVPNPNNCECILPYMGGTLTPSPHSRASYRV